MKVLFDSSSAILLYKAGLIHIFLNSVEGLLPVEVFNELTCCQHEGAEWFRLQHGFSILQRVQCSVPSGLPDDQTRRLQQFGPGEKALLAALMAGKAHYAVIDDGPAARLFHQQGLPFINALLVPRILYLSGAMQYKHCRAFQDHLLALGRYGHHVIDYALHCADEKLDFFLVGA